MSITYNSENKVFKLDAKNTTYAFFIHEGGWLVNLYYGKTLNSDDLRYLENTIRNAYDFSGTPIKVVVREKKDEE